MKQLLLIVAAMCLASCVYLQESCSLGQTRDEAMFGKVVAGATDENQDTLIYVCAVEVPDSYDWQKDENMGLGPGSLLFYKNHKLQLEQQLGYSNAVSSDADTHHIISGHLITEFSQADRTIIKKDGETLLEIGTREYLLGLLEEEGVIHTLGVDRSSGGLNYRKNGELVFSHTDAFAFGSFQETTYPETGALYLSDGKVTFCYKLETDGNVFYHLVKDGYDNQIVLNDYHYYYGVQDIRAVNGSVYIVSGLSTRGLMFGTASSGGFYGGDYNWSSLRIAVPETGEPSVFGKIAECSTALGYALVSGEGIIQTVDYQEAVCLEGHIFDVTHGDCVHFSNRTVCRIGSRPMEALTPKDMNKNPYLLSETGRVNYYIRGYITGLSAELSQSKSEFLSRPQRR